MGHATSSDMLGKYSTAQEVVIKYGNGNANWLSGKTAVVTGGNSGIGLETCKALAFGGCRVILCSRSVEAGQKAIESEIKCNGEGGYIADTSNIIVKSLDLNDLASVKRFAADFLQSESRLDYLICNAGIMALPNAEYTSSGFERQIGVNHFGHAYLCSLLENKLREQSFPSRIVMLASDAHRMGTINVDDMHFKNGRVYDPWEAYGQSKAANILYARGLAEHLKGTNVVVVSLHPGVIQTNLWNNNSNLKSRLIKAIFKDKTIPQGASNTLYCALSPDVNAHNGKYFVDCHVAEPASSHVKDIQGNVTKALFKSTAEQLQKATA